MIDDGLDFMKARHELQSFSGPVVGVPLFQNKTCGGLSFC
jgi:hypothetical protein